MTLLKFVLLWWLIGAVTQLLMILRLRQKYGRWSADTSMRIVFGSLWPLKIAVSCFFWPLGVYAWFFRRPTLKDFEQAKIVADQMGDRCPDCGEPLELHEPAEPPQ